MSKLVGKWQWYDVGEIGPNGFPVTPRGFTWEFNFMRNGKFSSNVFSGYKVVYGTYSYGDTLDGDSTLKLTVDKGLVSRISGDETEEINKSVEFRVEFNGDSNEFLELELLTDSWQLRTLSKFERLQKKGPCYVATCVYGTYDCPEVWTLRRYRDNVLSTTWIGRLAISLYYTISPSFVSLVGSHKWFHRLCRPIVGAIVKSLQHKGIESTYYDDKK